MKFPPYYEIRKAVSQIIPREKMLCERESREAVKEKGRKKGYQEFKLDKGWVKPDRLLDENEIDNFIEISCRAAACPMPLNIDVWDGLFCPYGCKYCFATAFRLTLYTAFFDNAKNLPLRHCNAEKYMQEMDKLFKCRGKNPHDVSNPISKALAMEIPIRFGIRFEDFMEEEESQGVSLQLMQYLTKNKYPFMINTKSDLVAKDKYLKTLAKNQAAVHVTLISSDNELLRKLEPGAPSYERRLAGIKAMVQAGVRVVARIEPFMPFVNDKPEAVAKYIEDVWDAGVRHMTFDTYSYTAKNPNIRESFRQEGLDWDRIFLIGCDSQPLGSLLLGSFMQMFRDKGFHCSSFDMGNVPDNSQAVCCEVGDWYKGGYNYGSSVVAARFIQSRGATPTTWTDFEIYVNQHGGFLSEALKKEVQLLWNVDGTNDAYSHSWARGMESVGYDRGGAVWIWRDTDFRQDMYNNIIGKL